MDSSFMSGAFNGLIKFLIFIVVLIGIAFYLLGGWMNKKDNEIKVKSKLKPTKIEITKNSNGVIDTVYVYNLDN